MKKIFLILMFLVSANAHAMLVKQTVDYTLNEVDLEGYLVYDDSFSGQRPGVLVVHEWMGLNEYAKQRADQLAQLGFVAFAADIYGKGIRPDTPQTAGAQAGIYKNNRALLRARVIAGLEQLKKQTDVDAKQIVAIGYCFGGTSVLELARSGVDIKGIVSFHGGLGAGDIGHQPIQTKILVLHGADDPFVPPSEVLSFKKEMIQSKADFKIISYPGAVHGFTNPQNTGTIPGALYNAAADSASWQAMLKFFKNIGIKKFRKQ